MKCDADELDFSFITRGKHLNGREDIRPYPFKQKQKKLLNKFLLKMSRIIMVTNHTIANMVIWLVTLFSKFNFVFEMGLG